MQAVGGRQDRPHSLQRGERWWSGSALTDAQRQPLATLQKKKALPKES